MEIDAEAREAVARRAQHPSLVVWNGCNENIWFFGEQADWRQQIGDRTWGDAYYRELLPGIIGELAPHTAYTPGSPYSFADYVQPNDEHNGSVHIWDVWNRRDYKGFSDWTPRFVAEFGFQGPPAWTTLTAVVHDEPLHPYGRQMLVHQKAIDGNLKLERGMLGHLPTPETIEDWHFATQLNQAAAMRFGIERFRSLHPYNTGMVLWQLNDNWPVISWSMIDFNGRRKPVWYAVRAAYSPNLATIQPTPSGLEVVVNVDSDRSINGRFCAQRISLDGSLIAEEMWEMFIPARSSGRHALPDSVSSSKDTAGEVLVVTGPGELSAVHHFAEVVDQRLDPEPFAAEAVLRKGEWEIAVHAHSLVRDLVMLADRAHPDASVHDSMITVLPGQTRVLHVHAPATADPTRLVAKDVLRSANQLRGQEPDQVASGAGRA